MSTLERYTPKDDNLRERIKPPTPDSGDYAEGLIRRRGPEIVQEGEDFHPFDPGAVAALDARGSTAVSDILKRHYDEVLRRTQEHDRARAEEKFKNAVGAMFAIVREEAASFNGILTDQIGDGTFVIFEGDAAAERLFLFSQNVHRRISAEVKPLEINGESYPLHLRVTADLVERQGDQSDLMSYNIGNGNRRFAGLLGRSLENAEALQKEVGDKALVLKMSDRMQAALELKSAEVESDVLSFDMMQRIKEREGEVTRSIPPQDPDYIKKFLPLAERKEIEQGVQENEGAFKHLTIYFARIDGLEETMKKAAQGDEEADAALQHITSVLAKAETNFDGRVRSIFRGRALITFDGDREGVEQAKEFDDLLAQEIKDLDTFRALNLDKVVDAEIGHSKTVLDQSVNAAARIVSSEQKPGLYVSSRVYNTLSSDYRIDAVKETRQYKGIQEAVVYEVRDMKPKTEIDQTMLVGREKEREVFRNVIRKTIIEDKPQLLIIDGPKGMGQEHLLRAETQYMRRLSVDTRGQSVEDPYAPFHSLAEQLFGTKGVKDQAEINSRVLQHLMQSDVEPEYYPLINPIAGTEFALESESVKALSDDEREALRGEMLAKMLHNEEVFQVLDVRSLSEFSPSSRRILEHMSAHLQGKVLEVLVLDDTDAKGAKEVMATLEDTFQKSSEYLSLEALPYYKKYDPDHEDSAAEEKWLNESDRKRYYAALFENALTFAKRHTFEKRIDGQTVKMESDFEDTPHFRRLAVITGYVSKGRPELIVDFVRYAAEKGFLVQNEAGEYTFAEGKDKRIKSSLFAEVATVTGMDQKKHEALPGSAQVLAEIAAQIGSRFSLEQLRAVLQSDSAKGMEEDIHVLIERGILTQIEDEDGSAIYEFLSPSFHSMLEGRSADRSAIARLNDRLLELTEETDSQNLFAKVRYARRGSHRNKWVQYQTELGERFRKDYAFSVAAEKIIPVVEDLIADDSDFPEKELIDKTIISTAEIYRLLGRDAKQVLGGQAVLLKNLMRLKEVIEQSSTEPSYELATFYLNLALRHSGGEAEAIENLIKDAEEIKSEIEDEDISGEILYAKQKCTLLDRLGKDLDATEEFDRSLLLMEKLARSERVSLPWLTQWYQVGIDTYMGAGRIDEALRLADQALNDLEGGSYELQIANIKRKMGSLHFMQGPEYFDQARKLLESAEKEYRSIYHYANEHEAMAQMYLGAISFAEKDYSAADEFFGRSSEYYEANDPESIAGYAAKILSVRNLLCIGKNEEARTILSSIDKEKLTPVQEMMVTAEEVMSGTQELSMAELESEIEKCYQITEDESERGELLMSLALAAKSQSLHDLSSYLYQLSEESYRKANDWGGPAMLQSAFSSPAYSEVPSA